MAALGENLVSPAAASHSLNNGLIITVTDYVKQYMSNYDGSHDFNHILRVVGLARTIYAQSPPTPVLDEQVVVLAALLHDVGDKKYLQPGEDASSLVYQLLLSYGATEELARRVQAVCTGVSYSSEIKDPAHVRDLISQYPELAVVQDADRLDAIGAVGIGRTFTFTGAKTKASMQNSIDHFEDKLLRLESMMKTEAGRNLARERTARLEVFRSWWEEECAFSHNQAGAPTV